MARILGTIASGFTEVAGFESIATSTVTSSGGTSSVSFNSIPSTYTHLQLRALVRNARTGSGGGTLRCVVNGDTSVNNYAYHSVQSDGSTVSASALASGNYGSFLVGWFPSADRDAGVFGGGVFDILDYASTNKYKTIRTISGWDNNGAGYVQTASNVWMSTAAVSSLVLSFVDNHTIVQNSHFALYGIKAA